jgi:hypothetical protein
MVGAPDVRIRKQGLEQIRGVGNGSGIGRDGPPTAIEPDGDSRIT